MKRRDRVRATEREEPIAEDEFEPTISNGTILIVGVILLALTALTVWVSTFNLGPFSTVIALGIAITKTILIALYFMHIRHANGTTRLVAVAGVMWLGILLVGTLDDFITRGWLPVPGK